MKNKDIRDLLTEYKSHGFRVEQGGSHFKIFDGPRMVTVIPSSQCRGRSRANSRAVLRRLVRERQAQVA